MAQVLALVGGMKNVVFLVMLILSQIFGKTEVMAQIIQNLSLNPVDLRLSEQFNSLKFQSQILVHRVFCCNKKTINFGSDFYSLLQDFEAWEKKIENYLSIKNVIIQRANVDLLNTEMFRLLSKEASPEAQNYFK